MKVFSNGDPLELATSDYTHALAALDLSAFPTIADFTIELRNSEELGQMSTGRSSPSSTADSCR